MSSEKAQRRVPRPANAYPDNLVWPRLGISRSTFFRKLTTGELTPPVPRDGTKRRWWTEADIQCAQLELLEDKDRK